MKCNLVVGDEVVGKIPNGSAQKMSPFEVLMFMIKYSGRQYVIDGVTHIDDLMKILPLDAMDDRLKDKSHEENQFWIHFKGDTNPENWVNAHFFQKVIKTDIKTDISVFEKILETAKKEKKIPVDADA